MIPEFPATFGKTGRLGPGSGPVALASVREGVPARRGAPARREGPARREVPARREALGRGGPSEVPDSVGGFLPRTAEYQLVGGVRRCLAAWSPFHPGGHGTLRSRPGGLRPDPEVPGCYAGCDA
jgi:hypothetical protein